MILFFWDFGTSDVKRSHASGKCFWAPPPNACFVSSGVARNIPRSIIPVTFCGCSAA